MLWVTNGSAGGLEFCKSAEVWERVPTQNICYISIQNCEFLWLEGAAVGMREMTWTKTSWSWGQDAFPADLGLKEDW